MDTKIKKKVLVIDDEQTAFGLIGNTLGPRGFDVYALSNIEDVVEETKKIRPDLIFISLLLNESNGLKVSKSIRSAEGLKDAPIVMMISFHGELDPKYTKTIGIMDVLVKPLSENEVLSKTLSILGVDVAADGAEEFLEVYADKELSAGYPEKEWSDEFNLEVEQFGGSEKTLEDELSRPLEIQEDNEDIFKIGEDTADHTKFTELPGDKDGSTDDYADYDLQDEGLDTSHERAEKAGEEADLPGLSYEAEDPGEGKESLQQNGPSPVSKKTTPNKILLLVFALISIVGLGTAAFFVKNTFYTKKPVPVSSVVKKALPEKEPAKQETAVEKAMPAETKPDEGSTVAGVGKAEKPAAEEPAVKSPPASSVKPPFREDQQDASGTPPFKTGKKTVEEKKETVKVPKEGAYIYAAQAGVFENEKNADALAAKFKKMGLNAYIRKDSGVIVLKKNKGELISENTVMYRVLIGKFDDNKKALEQVRFLKEDSIDAVPFRY